MSSFSYEICLISERSFSLNFNKCPYYLLHSRTQYFFLNLILIITVLQIKQFYHIFKTILGTKLFIFVLMEKGYGLEFFSSKTQVFLEAFMLVLQ